MPLVGSGVNQSHDCQVGALPFARAGMLLFPAVFPIAFVNVAREDATAKQVVPVLVILVGLGGRLSAAPDFAA